MNRFRISEKNRAKYAQRIQETLTKLFPFRDASLTVEDLIAATRKVLQNLPVSAETWEGFQVQTVKYYKRRRIVSPPEGRTSNARYSVRHVIEAAAARIASELHQITLEDLADKIRGLSDTQLQEYVAELALMDWASRAAKSPELSNSDPDTLLPEISENESAQSARVIHTVSIQLPHGMLVTVPSEHPLLRAGHSPGRIAEFLKIALADMPEEE